MKLMMTILITLSSLFSISALAQKYVEGPGRYSCDYQTPPFNSNNLNILNNQIYQGFGPPRQKLGNCVTTEEKVTCVIEAIPELDTIATTVEISGLQEQSLTAIMYPTHCSALGKFCKKISIDCNRYNYFGP